MKKTKKKKLKHLCKLSKKEIEERLSEITLLICNPHYICTKCARAACVEEVLCHPKNIQN